MLGEAYLRRRLLQVVGAFFLNDTVLVPSARAAPEPTQLDRRTFAAFLDVLLPRDASSGSATQLGVDRVLLEFSLLDERFRRLIELGNTWLNMTGRGSFADLPSVDQIKVVEWMAGADWNQVPRRFYELVRQAAVETYFSNPASLVGLPLKPSPQPQGYPPPWA
jgi:hypothetical protein